MIALYCQRSGVRFWTPNGTYSYMLSGRHSLVVWAVAAASGVAMAANVGGPVTGFVLDSQAGAIRPMLGIPGAAYLGAPVISKVDAGSVSPDGSAALVMQGDRLMLYTGLRSQTSGAAAVQGAIANVNWFAWAPDGGSAAVYSFRKAQAQILSGLPQLPAAGAAIDLSNIPGQVSALAFDGQRVLIGVASSDSGGIYAASAQAPPQKLAPAVSPSAIALAGTDLYFADNQSQEIWQVQTYAASPAPVLFAGGSGISSPAGLQLSGDGKRLYVANAASHTVAAYDTASRASIRSFDLSFAPSRMDRFGDAAVFQLNDTGQGPIYVLRDAVEPTVYFVPAPGNTTTPHKIRILPK